MAKSQVIILHGFILRNSFVVIKKYIISPADDCVLSLLSLSDNSNIIFATLLIVLVVRILIVLAGSLTFQYV